MTSTRVADAHGLFSLPLSPLKGSGDRRAGRSGSGCSRNCRLSRASPRPRAGSYLARTRMRAGAARDPKGHQMTVTLKPLGDRVVVRPKPKDETTSSGIVLPDTASEKPQEGSVLSVGPGRVLDSGKRVEMDVQVGDSVLFARYAGTEVKLDGDEYLVIRESDLLAIVTNGKK